MSRFLRTFEANSPKRHGKKDKQIELSQTEIELAFASFCIEGTARKLGLPYQEVFARMKRVGKPRTRNRQYRRNLLPTIQYTRFII